MTGAASDDGAQPARTPAARPARSGPGDRPDGGPEAGSRARDSCAGRHIPASLLSAGPGSRPVSSRPVFGDDPQTLRADNSVDMSRRPKRPRFEGKLPRAAGMVPTVRGAMPSGWSRRSPPGPATRSTWESCADRCGAAATEAVIRPARRSGCGRARQARPARPAAAVAPLPYNPVRADIAQR